MKNTTTTRQQQQQLDVMCCFASLYVYLYKIYCECYIRMKLSSILVGVYILPLSIYMLYVQFFAVGR